MKGFLQFHLSVKFQASGNRIIPFASLNFWFDSFPLPKRKKPRVHQVDKMNRPTARNNYKRYSQEDSVDITSELLRYAFMHSCLLNATASFAIIDFLWDVLKDFKFSIMGVLHWPMMTTAWIALALVDGS
ncbi:hypothetical protein I3760_08G017900 [Carya illinoinensis]|nr:hypothetical protein I3760_08G017900 [Carya illinoinensis]KAG2691661.1 hypothetical protein I3760_08G017900 [Carya illinoinensis]